MAKDKLPVVRSQKSTRPNHKKFKDLYAANQPTATTPDLAGREPRQVPQTPSSDGATTDGTTTGNESTPSKKTPAKKPSPSKRAAKTKKPKKWEHVPSASTYEATQFENFENADGAQPAKTKMKTRKLQWSRETVTEAEQSQPATAEESSAGEQSVRQEVIDGFCYGSTGTVRLPPMEMTQADEGKGNEQTQEDADLRERREELPLLSPQPGSPKKDKEKEKEKETPKEAAKEVVMSPPKPAPVKEAVVVKDTKASTKEVHKTVRARQNESTKREKRILVDGVLVKKPIKASSRETKKPAAVHVLVPAPTPAPVPGPVPAVPVPAPVPVAPPPPNNARDDPVTVRDAKAKDHTKEEPQTAHYKQAVALMKMLKRNNYLENALRFEEGEKIRKHYEAVGFNQPPPPHILALLNKALDFVLESVLFRAEDLDTSISNEMRVFIIKKQEARQAMLEVILHRPYLMPTTWGGARADAKRSKGSKKSGEKKRGWFTSFFR